MKPSLVIPFDKIAASRIEHKLINNNSVQLPITTVFKRIGIKELYLVLIPLPKHELFKGYYYRAEITSVKPDKNFVEYAHSDFSVLQCLEATFKLIPDEEIFDE